MKKPKTKPKGIRQKLYRAGDLVKVHSVGEDRLPFGLPEGVTVKIVARTIGSINRTVEWDGWQFDVPAACIDARIPRASKGKD